MVLDCAELQKRSLDLPSFHPHVSVPVHENVHAAQQATVAWALTFGLVDDVGVETLRRAQIAWLSGLTQPYSDELGLQLAADWHTWLFVRDDRFDGTCAGRDAATVARFDAVFDGVLAGVAPPADRDPLCGALWDIRQRLLQAGGPSWVERFAQHTRMYLQSNAWEAVNRQTQTPPCLSSYRMMRRHTSAVNPCLDLIFGTLGFAGDDELVHHVLGAQLLQMTNNHISWVNDICGLGKELGEGNVNNLVLVLYANSDQPLQGCIDEAVRMCNEEYTSFVNMCEHLPTHPRRARFVEVCERWMFGHIDWYARTARYKV